MKVAACFILMVRTLQSKHLPSVMQFDPQMMQHNYPPIRTADIGLRWTATHRGGGRFAQALALI
ncbi:MAG: hypothetical protein J0I77_13800 [Rudaea sp.]|uniref:hypothetical protein n=1 Tax=unclassified Rudaea TaxID=2627037 RepID=UPI0010F7AA7B|nr:MULTISPECIES: hypothetical protein [unclassified Rudaea]MBN8886788.1 hypothetical protein [Rudaea sp.]